MTAGYGGVDIIKKCTLEVKKGSFIFLTTLKNTWWSFTMNHSLSMIYSIIYEYMSKILITWNIIGQD